MIEILNWLRNKLVNQDNGIIFDRNNLSFSTIQDFIENNDRKFKTPVIYYQAFPEENPTQFVNTLIEELISKLGKLKSNSPQSLLNIVENAGLKIIIIDDCHLHPQDTLENLLNFFSSCNVAVILVGDREKMAIAQILNNPLVRQWDKLEVAGEYETICQ